ncbi:MAG: hypothetical protein HY329_17270 [Chloroflexi bacterium]|nr:hypothetical protein [Chloroflexota bacterium]
MNLLTTAAHFVPETNIRLVAKLEVKQLVLPHAGPPRTRTQTRPSASSGSEQLSEDAEHPLCRGIVDNLSDVSPGAPLTDGANLIEDEQGLLVLKRYGTRVG